jgi:HK97 family phage prohead protease
MEYKVFQSKVQDVDQKKGIVINYDNAFNTVDTDGDISRKGAYKKTLVENASRAKWYLNHDQGLLLGVPFIEGTKEDDFGLLSYNHINTSKQLGADTLTDYMLFKEYDRTLEHSMGYNATKYNPYDLGKGGKGRELTEVKIWEKSTLTSWGANSDTPLVDIKSLKDIDKMLEMLEQMFTKNLQYSDERKRAAEKLFLELKSLSKEEPGETTLIKEPTSQQILETILKSLKNGSERLG